jgi:glycosyltransferase involved in cell wall biosynthesis
VAPVVDASGYANAARNNIAAMVKAGIRLTVDPISFEQKHTYHGNISKLIQNHIRCQSRWDINLVHATPENWAGLEDKGSYNIGYTVWETDRLPAEWVTIMNARMNEIWVPTHWNKELFKSSGVTKPITVIPHTLDVSCLSETIETLPSNNKYKFYSIFQWTERKNAKNLIMAYLKAFTGNDNVVLMLKTYCFGWDDKQQTHTKNMIREMKSQFTNPPEIRFIGSLLTGDEVNRIHATGDCFYLPHRGEGFGLPLAEAMMFGKPVITTNWSGNLDFTKPEYSYLVDYKLVPVGNMPWGKYTPDQNWAEPSEEDMVAKLRYVYTHQDEAKTKGLLGQKFLVDNFSHEKIGQLIKETVNGIKI